MPVNKVDYLKEDPDIPNQRFCCLSFIEPRDQKVMTQKEVFMASKFITHFLNEYETAKEYTSNSNNTVTEEIQKKLDLSEDNVTEAYKGFRKSFFTKISEEFDKKHNPREAITVSGVKVRGSYRTSEEAETRAQEMRNYEPAVNCFVAQVGYWLPYDPENMEDIKANFREEQLNEIYGKRQEALESARADFEKRKQDMIEKNKNEQIVKEIELDEQTEAEVMETMTTSEPHHKRKEKKEKKQSKPVRAKKAGNMRVKRKH